MKLNVTGGGWLRKPWSNNAKTSRLISFSWVVLLWLIATDGFAEKPDLFLLNTYQNQQNVTGWVMSEKLDGVRAYWDGQQLISRGGQIFNAPEWFIRDFPPFELDGELWSKRGDFENIVSIVRQQQPDERWSQISYQVFEVPQQPGGLLTRIAVLQAYLKSAGLQSAPLQSTERSPQAVQPLHLSIVPQFTIENQAHLNEFFQQVAGEGGEGVVVRNPDTAYQTGRLNDALKVKSYQDEECEVTGYQPGRGKFKGLVGALECRLLNQNLIRIGSGLSDQQRKHPPAIGSVVTFKYYGLTAKGLPRFPVFLRIRSDTEQAR